MWAGVAASVALPLVLAAAPAHAALTLTFERTRGAEKSTHAGYLDGQKLRMEQPGASGRGNKVMIFDGGSKKLLIVDADTKSWMEIGEEEVKQMKARMDGMRAQMAGQLDKLPPDRRAQAEQMMNGTATELAFAPQGQKKTVNGFACEMYKVTMGGRPFEDSCIAAWNSGALAKADADAIRSVFGSLQALFASLPFAKTMNLGRFPGLPVQTVHQEPAGGESWQDNLKSIKRGAVSADLFQVPPGYKKVINPVMAQQPPSAPAARPQRP